MNIAAQISCDENVLSIIKHFSPTKEELIWLQKEVNNFSQYQVEQIDCLTKSLVEQNKEILETIVDSSDLRNILANEIQVTTFQDKWNCKLKYVKYFLEINRNKIQKDNLRVFNKTRYFDPEKEPVAFENSMKKKFKKAQRLLIISRPIKLTNNYYLYYFEIGYRPLDFSGGFLLLNNSNGEVKILSQLCGWVS